VGASKVFRILRSVLGGGWGDFFSLTGSLSIIALAAFGLKFGVSATFKVLLEYYDKTVDALIGWAGPFIENISTYLGWHIALYSHWKYIFVLTSIYFSQNAWNSFTSRDYFTGVFELIWGLVVAGAVSIVAGQVSLTTTSIVDNALIGIFAVVGVFLYESIDVAWRATFYRKKAARIYQQGYWAADGSVWYPPPPSWWKYFRGGLLGSLFRSFVGLVILAVGVAAFYVRPLPSFGLILVAAMVFVQAANFLRMGIRDAKTLAKPEEPLSEAYLRSGVAKVGIRMIRVFVWFANFLLLNAGLGLLGL
jgi:hypothetical protein